MHCLVAVLSRLGLGRDVSALVQHGKCGDGVLFLVVLIDLAAGGQDFVPLGVSDGTRGHHNRLCAMHNATLTHHGGPGVVRRGHSGDLEIFVGDVADTAETGVEGGGLGGGGSRRGWFVFLFCACSCGFATCASTASLPPPRPPRSLRLEMISRYFFKESSDG